MRRARRVSAWSVLGSVLEQAEGALSRSNSRVCSLGAEGERIWPYATRSARRAAKRPCEQAREGRARGGHQSVPVHLVLAGRELLNGGLEDRELTGDRQSVLFTRGLG